MAYRELVNVAAGIKAQLDACISALDLHEQVPEEAELLTNKLEEAGVLCDTLVRRGEAEHEQVASEIASQNAA